MRLARTRISLLLLAVVSAVLLAACGGGSGGSTQAAGEGATTGASSGAVLAAAVTKTTDAGSSKVSLNITLQVPGKDGPITIQGNGSQNYQTQMGELTLDLSQAFAAAGQSALGNEPVDIVYDKTVFYLKLGALTQLIPGGKPWLKVDLQKLGKVQGIDVSQFTQLNQGDPASTLAYLRATGDVQEIGQEQVNGVSTTHYRAVVDLDRVVQQAPAELRTKLQQSVDQLKQQLGGSKYPIEVWVDADGRVTRLKEDLKVSTNGQETTSIVQLDLTDWGTPVSITTPPADQVTDISALAALAGAGSTTG